MSLLEIGRISWTERGLMKLVRLIATQRLKQLGTVQPAAVIVDDASADLKAAMLEAMAEAALGGHELGEWEPVENGYQARCSLCGGTTWLGHDGLRYSLLEDECPGQDNTDEPGQESGR